LERAVTHSLSDLEDKIAAGQPLSRVEAERVAAAPDLPTVGQLGETARKARHGDRVTYVRVCEVPMDIRDVRRGEAGEVRIVGAPASIEAARAHVQSVARQAVGVPLTGYSLADLVQLVQGDHLALAEVARHLKHEGLEAVADVPLDGLGDLENTIEVIRAVQHGGLGAWRATIGRAGIGERLALIEHASAIQRATGAFKSLAPLPRMDAADVPSTGYDDVRTIALARLMCPEIPSIQVDWLLYGPKLAQVAIAFGADDIDRVAPEASAEMGRRRAPREEIERHIRMAFAAPAERDGRYETRS
jgi:aminodeoxyfutalosine synthase